MANAVWLADVLRSAGLSVVEHEGWQQRGRGPMSEVKGVLLHHTGGPPAPKGGATPALNLVLNGRADLPGPLSQLYLARDGTFHVLAAGRCNHAGAGAWRGITGNSSSIGIEAENAGDGNDPWPAVQMTAYAKGVAAILKHLGLSADDACGHKEYAQPHGRKIDPSFSMGEFRLAVRAAMLGAPTDIVASITVNPTPISPRTVKLGSTGEPVRLLQEALNKALGLALRCDGDFGERTAAAVRDFQTKHGLTADGVAGPKTWAALG